MPLSNPFSITISSAPAWFTGLTAGVWGSVAGSAGDYISSVAPSPIPPGSTGQRSVVDAWTGGCVDQSRRELLLVCNGGHGDYSGNEAYGLMLGEATPQWSRLCEPTPNGSIIDNPIYSDGRPSSVHGWNTLVFGNGKAWICGQDSTYQQDSITNFVWSWNRTHSGMPLVKRGAPLAHDGGLGPWVRYANLASGVTTGAQKCTAYDSVDNKIWVFNGANRNPTSYWSVDAANGASVAYPNSSASVMSEQAWAICAPELRIVVLGSRVVNEGSVGVIDLANPTSFIRYTTSGYTAGTHGPRVGAVYHAPTKTIYCYDTNFGKTVRKLTIPTSGGTFNPAGTWTWSSTTPAGGLTPTPGGNYAGTYGKFNIVNNMGNGEACLVAATHASGPTYVMRVPAGGI